MRTLILLSAAVVVAAAFMRKPRVCRQVGRRLVQLGERLGADADAVGPCKRLRR
jgi:hypothetical protein